MAQPSSAAYPYGTEEDSGDVEEVQWRKMMGHVLTDGVLRGEGLELEVYADASGMQVKVRGGAAWLAGTYGEWTGTTYTMAVPGTLPGAGQSRIARIVMRNRLVDRIFELDVLPGTNASSPTAPALTQNGTIWERPLAQVLILSGDTNIAAGRVTDERLFSRGVHGSLQPGFVMVALGATPPAGFASGGQAVSKVTYPEAFAVFGHQYNPGGAGIDPGNGTFWLPTLADTVIAGSSGTYPRGTILGADAKPIAVANMPGHDHGGLTGTDTPEHRHTLESLIVPFNNPVGGTFTNGQTSSSYKLAGGNLVASAFGHAYFLAGQGGSAGTYGQTGPPDPVHRHLIAAQGGSVNFDVRQRTTYLPTWVALRP